MLGGDRVCLRPVRRDELPALHAWRLDVETWLSTQDGPYQPTSFERFEAWWLAQEDDSGIGFGVEADGRLVGCCGLWGVDTHNRCAHVSVSIGDQQNRGQGLGRDVLAVLSDYGLRLRGLHRLQLETLATNDAMHRTAVSVGYREEGRLRGKAYVAGRWVDEIVLGLLADDWLGKGE